MALVEKVLATVVLLVLPLTFQAARTSATTILQEASVYDVPRILGSVGAVGRVSIDAVLSQLDVRVSNHAHGRGHKGRASRFSSGGTEGIACSWEVFAPTFQACLTNWNQFNRTLTPNNDMSQATVNVLAKAYACHFHSDRTGCSALTHCRWNTRHESCSLSDFYYTLLYGCHDSAVRNMSICIDYSAAGCQRDRRCKWVALDGRAHRCLPTSAPDTWTFAGFEQWLDELMNNESTFYDTWGDCPASHAWHMLTSCQVHSSQEECGKDEKCQWLDFVSLCNLTPEKVVEFLWGGDADTKSAVGQREKYCLAQGTQDACLRAMPNPQHVQV